MEHNVDSYLELSFHDSYSKKIFKKLFVFTLLLIITLSIAKQYSYRTYNYVKRMDSLEIICGTHCNDIKDNHEIIIKNKTYKYSVVSSNNQNIHLVINKLNEIDEQGKFMIKGKKMMAISSLINIFKERS